MKFCTKCGFEMKDDVRFCPKCGTEQSVQDMNGETSNNKISNDAIAVDNREHVANNEQNIRSNNYQNTRLSDNELKIGQPHHLNFMESLGYIFTNMFSFSTSVQDNQKSIFWWNYLLIIVVSIILTPTVQAIGYFEYLIFNNLIGIFSVASIMRRLNYLGKNKNLAWLVIVPVVFIYPLILMFFNKKENNY